MNSIRYRTESYSGEGIRNAAEVMAYETFVLGNTDILEYLQTHALKGSSIAPALRSAETELLENGQVDDMGWGEKVAFCQKVLSELSKTVGKQINYVLWLADLPAVLDTKFGYGRGISAEAPIDAYEISSVILSDLGYDGTLYGFETCPVPLHSYSKKELDEFAELTRESSFHCPRCGGELYPGDVQGYPFVCFRCDENFYRIEAICKTRIPTQADKSNIEEKRDRNDF